MRSSGAILLSLCLLRTTPADGQVLVGILLGDKLSSETFNIGLELGMNLSTLDDMEGAERMTGPMIGLFASWRFSEHVHLQPSILFLSKKGAKNATPIPLGDPELDPLIAGGRLTRTLSYIDIPVLLQWAPQRNTGLRVGLGPQIGFLLSADDRYDGRSSTGTPVVIEKDIESRAAGIDAGVAFDAEYRIGSTGLAIGIRYYHGLTSLLPDDPGPAIHQRVLSGSGRISLGGRKKE